VRRICDAWRFGAVAGIAGRHRIQGENSVRNYLIIGIAAMSVLAGHAAFASGAEGGHGGAVVGVLVALVVILVAAKLGGDWAMRLKQPAVLGELILGVILGNLALIGIDWFEAIRHNPTIEVLAEIGVILLLFEVGLESELGEMMKVGLSSFLVALFGVIAPFFLGWGVGMWFYPDASIYVHIFLGATLTATSVGITARVLKDINRLNTSEARIILGAAVIDDVMGLVILAIVAGMIHAADTGQEMSSGAILWLVAKAVLFLLGAVLAGRLIYPRVFKVANYLRTHGLLLVTSLGACFLSSIFAAQVGLAPIVGAFAAGLVLDPVYYRDLPNLAKHRLEEVLEPVTVFLVPVFFVLMGMRVDLTTFGQASCLGFAALLSIAAVISKQVSSFGVMAKGQPTNRWIVGLGMIPRGEVGLIFAGIGLGLTYGGSPIVSSEIYSAVVIMVIITTLVTPPILTWAFGLKGPTEPAPASDEETQ
jgi:Kef-type K+ transport system membrane component KefB